MHGKSYFLTLSILVLVACSPNGRPGGHGPDAGGTCQAGTENTPEACSDGIDNDCDGLYDCQDPECSGIGNCPVCGTVEHPTGMPVDLPDGTCGCDPNDPSCDCTCSSTAQCAAHMPAGQLCYASIGECRESYTSKLHFMGFAQGQQMMATSDIVSVCVNMSHEWVRDLEIDLVSPDGKRFALDKFEGQDCPTGPCEVFLGHPADSDDDCPGCVEQGFDYCWTPTATNKPVIDYANASMPMMQYQGTDMLPPGNYQASDPWSALIGSTLNGDWTIEVTDLWPIDAGKLHSWTLSFNPNIVQTCDPPTQ